MKVLINETVEIESLTTEMIADAFWDLDNIEQADFFNHLAELANEIQLSKQMKLVSYSKNLTYGGMRVMAQIGDYSHWGFVPKIKMNPSTGKETVE